MKSALLTEIASCLPFFRLWTRVLRGLYLATLRNVGIGPAPEDATIAKWNPLRADFLSLS
jgi:hypothetical protein